VTPGPRDLWFLPLGGTGEIGMNLNLYGHDGSWLMVDCGVTFERSPGARQARVEMPDPAFAVANRARLAGIVATHAHEDHLGALPWLWPLLRAPLYTTPFTAAVLRRKCEGREAEVPAPLNVVAPGDRRQLGPFTVQWLPMTHSTPETCALHVSCPAGSVLHTADWKIDPAPVVGPAFDAAPFAALGDGRLDAVVCDSTNALRPGRSPSEGELAQGLGAALAAQPGRVVVACFASNVARLRTLLAAGRAAGRYAGLLGRSLRTMADCARACGYLAAGDRLAPSSHLGYLPPREVLAIATGSQGEAGAALDRLARDNHPDLSLEAGDCVLFSARTIPGNETAVARLRQRFGERGITVLHADDDRGPPLHASGHPCSDELADLYRWLRPRLAVPVHGEPPHLAVNAATARAAGVRLALTGANGDLFHLAPEPGVRRRAVPTGRWTPAVDGTLQPVSP
jgi:ribonuclease J